ncbi:hypothetical protein GF385_03260 [Candidatus Dependentiae bacterium]|nr:hypothetical protein [Candidatus Dependentiae bacterium]
MKKIILSFLLSILIFNNQNSLCNNQTTTKESTKKDVYRKTMYNLSAETLRLLGIFLAELSNIENEILNDPIANQNYQNSIIKRIQTLIKEDKNAEILINISSPFIVKVYSNEMNIKTALEKILTKLENQEKLYLSNALISILDFYMPENEQGKFKELWNNYINIYIENNDCIKDSFDPFYHNKEENKNLCKVFLNSIIKNIKYFDKKEESNIQEKLDMAANLFAECEEISKSKLNEYSIQNKDSNSTLNIVQKILNLLLKEIKKELNITELNKEKEVKDKLNLLSKKIILEIEKTPEKKSEDNMKKPKTKEEFIFNFQQEIKNKIDYFKNN